MPRLAHVALIVTVLIPALTLAVPRAALAQEGEATRYLRSRNEDVEELLRTPASATRDGRVTAILSDLLDYDELAHRSLSTHWDGLTAAQRTEFTDLLRQLVEQQYRTSMSRILDYEVVYVSEAAGDGGGRTVTTEARSRASRREPPVAIVYTAHRVGSAWRVYDVTTDGVSMIQNYQRQFNSIITRDGFPALITRMRERLARGSATGD